jgi:hypothetical protein
MSATGTFHLHLGAFIVAFSLGLLYVYLATPHRKIIIRHPTQDNLGKVIYEDGNGNCFVLKKMGVDCDHK